MSLVIVFAFILRMPFEDAGEVDGGIPEPAPAAAPHGRLAGRPPHRGVALGRLPHRLESYETQQQDRINI